MPDTITVASFTHDGSSNFAITALDDSLDHIELLVNTIGPYTGMVLVPANTSNLEVTADGRWTIELKSASSVRTFEAGSINGRGDEVVFYLGKTNRAAMTHTGESNFAVRSISADDPSDLLVNEIGAYSGTVRLPGPSLMVITADGSWTITIP